MKNIAERFDDYCATLNLSSDNAINVYKVINWLKEQPEMNYLEKQDSWVSVNDMPELNKPVLILTKKRQLIYQGYLKKNEDYGLLLYEQEFHFFTSDNLLYFNLTEITHWQNSPELPELPKKQE